MTQENVSENADIIEYYKERSKRIRNDGYSMEADVFDGETEELERLIKETMKLEERLENARL